MSVNDRFTLLLKKIKKTANALSKDIGVTPPTIKKIEKGETNPSGTVLIFLIENYGVNANWLLTGQGQMFINKSSSNNHIQKIDTNQGIVSQMGGNSKINYGTNDTSTKGNDCSKLEIENDRLKLENKFLKNSLTDKERLINLLEKNQK